MSHASKYLSTDVTVVTLNLSKVYGLFMKFKRLGVFETLVTAVALEFRNREVGKFCVRSEALH